MPVLRLEGAVHAIAVGLPGARLGEVDVPDLVGVLLHADALAFTPWVLRVEEAEVDRCPVLAEEGEVDPRPVPGGAKGIGRSGARARHRPVHERPSRWSMATGNTSNSLAS